MTGQRATEVWISDPLDSPWLTLRSRQCCIDRIVDVQRTGLMTGRWDSDTLPNAPS